MSRTLAALAVGIAVTSGTPAGAQGPVGTVAARCDHYVVASAGASNAVALVVSANTGGSDALVVDVECVAYRDKASVRANGRGSGPLAVGAGAGMLPAGQPTICLRVAALYLDGSYVVWSPVCHEGGGPAVFTVPRRVPGFG